MSSLGSRLMKFGLLSFLLVILVPGARAAGKEAAVTERVKDVRLLLPHAQPRPIVLNENVHDGSAVRTGAESRAELTFVDQTITRLGENTVFNVGTEARTYNLNSGAILMYAPRNAGEIQIHTTTMTVAVTGFTALADAGPYKKLILVEGKAEVWLTQHPRERKSMHSGQLIAIPPGATKLPPVLDFDVCKLIANGRLFTAFKRKLPSWNLILDQCKSQQADQQAGNLIDPTNLNAVDQARSALPPPPASRPPPTPPPR